MQGKDWTFGLTPGLREMGRNAVHNVYLYRRPSPPAEARLDGQTIIVTGSNRTMGKAIAEDLAGRGARVLMACRNVQLAEEAAADIRSRLPEATLVCYKLDLSSLQSIRAFVTVITEKEKRLDVLVNNAAILVTSGRQETEDGFEMMIGVNYFGTVLLSLLLLDHMKNTAPDPRIVSTASLAHRQVEDIRWDDIQSQDQTDSSFRTGLQTYSHSKLALLLFTREFARRAFKLGVRVYAVDPGISGTDLGREMAGSAKRTVAFVLLRPIMRSVRDAANSVVMSVIAPKDSYQPDVYYFTDGEVQSLSVAAESDEKAEKLWKLTSQTLNLENMLTL